MYFNFKIVMSKLCTQYIQYLFFPSGTRDSFWKWFVLLRCNPSVPTVPTTISS